MRWEIINNFINIKVIWGNTSCPVNINVRFVAFLINEPAHSLRTSTTEHDPFYLTRIKLYEKRVDTNYFKPKCKCSSTAMAMMWKLKKISYTADSHVRLHHKTEGKIIQMSEMSVHIVTVALNWRLILNIMILSSLTSRIQL